MEQKLSWNELNVLARKVANQISESGFLPDYLIGVTVGGLIPLGLIAKELDIRNILTVSSSSYKGKVQQDELKIRYLPEIDLSCKKLLLIDEIADTGITLEKLSGVIKEKYNPSELRTATLVLNTKRSIFKPDYFAMETEVWVVFPWEKEEK